ncbi:MAG: HAD-IB family phosphatase [Acidimicrobiia bacterium]|nr:HAD-IB family phosphatase [Acidimicrobiia bacterium]
MLNQGRNDVHLAGEGSNLKQVPWRSFPVTIFDCDSTLSAVEGIEELATEPTDRERIAELTDSAMAGDMALEDVYGERLSLLQPTRAQVTAIRERYKANVVTHAKEVMAALHFVEHQTWVVSGGLAQPVMEFATWLGIDPANVHAVHTEFDPFEGTWWEAHCPQAQGRARYADHDRGHLTSSTGKAEVIRSRVTTPGRRLLIGDGVSDLAAADAVDLFVAFAGVVDRPSVTEAAPAVITSPSLAPTLALALGPDEVKELIGGPHDDVARACWDLVNEGAIRFNDKALESRFNSSL